ncbi:Type II secretion envelope pseudopilin protein (PulG,guides folded protein to PulD in outer membrane) [hydrothermal vent metagenome]|uniref:Type II secretion envelope pseudopilin protein (PulG,guides folded protein to PulD in outer membrane) n=1 Tax=hydrothermal vent metagenome TaxID=652676 RepID=A0A1W1BTI0_9ZZZZ
MRSKKAFTIIEMIIVIVIIGILSIVAIPRLSATYDDAKVTIALNNIGTMINDVSSYYTSFDRYSANLNDMTNIEDINYTVPWNNITQSGVFTYYTLDNELNFEPCISFSIMNRDGNLTISTIDNPIGDICKILQSVDSLQNLLGTKLIGGNRIKF